MFFIVQTVAVSVMATISQLMQTDEEQHSEDTYDALERYLHTTLYIEYILILQKNKDNYLVNQM